MPSLIITHPSNLFKMNEETTNQIHLLFSGFCFAYDSLNIANKTIGEGFQKGI